MNNITVKAPNAILAGFDQLIIYGNGNIFFKRDGQLEKYSISPDSNGNEKISTVYLEPELTEIILSRPLKKALKENLSRTDNYHMNYSPDYDRRSIRTALYIHISEVNIEDLGDVLYMISSEEKNYLHAARLHFNNPVTVKTYHLERIPLDGEARKTWTLPEGAVWSSCYGPASRPCYELYDCKTSILRARRDEEGVIKRWHTVDQLPAGYEFISAFNYFSKTEISDERKRKIELANRLNATGKYNQHPWSHYDITRLEEALGYKLH